LQIQEPNFLNFGFHVVKNSIEFTIEKITTKKEKAKPFFY